MAGGTVSVNNTTLLHNQAAGSYGTGGGGGIYVAAGTASLNNSTLSNNQAVASWVGDGQGGGIYVAGGTVSVKDNTLFNNEATGADGGCFGQKRGCYGPGAGLGGGIYVAGGTVHIFQNTVSANRSTGGRGIWGKSDGLGGGLFVSGGTVEVQHSTFSANRAANGERWGQGSGGGLVFTTGILRTRNTILAGNTATSTAPDLSGNLGSLGHSLIGDSTGGSGFDPTDLLDVDPGLGPLQDNGGPTLTHALLDGSLVIGAGDIEDAPEFDQRGPGFPRIVDGMIDIGAFEVQ